MIHGDSELEANGYGEKSQLLRKLYKMGIPIPNGMLISAEDVSLIASGQLGIREEICSAKHGLYSLRSSSIGRYWGGVDAILNLGMTDQYAEELSKEIGEKGALVLYRRFIQSFSVSVYNIEPEIFENLFYDQMRLVDVSDENLLDLHSLKQIIVGSKNVFKDEIGFSFPQVLSEQLDAAIKSMARAWYRPSAKILRQVRGAPENAGMGLILQEMVLGIGKNLSGSGQINTIDESTGVKRLHGYFLPNSQGNDSVMGLRTPHLLTEKSRVSEGQTAPSFEILHPNALKSIRRVVKEISFSLGDVFNFQFTIENDVFYILDAHKAERSARASVKIAVELEKVGAISKQQALMKVEPHNLVEFLHPKIDPNVNKDIFAYGLPASPGASSGKLVFSSEAAALLKSKGESSILVRVETSPEDIRGMHASSGILTVRGGMTSHAAVIARGLGLPCVVGATDLKLNLSKKTVTTKIGQKFFEGDEITVDGTAGEAIVGRANMIQPEISGSFSTLMQWADEYRTIGVRGNVDNPNDAKLSKVFGVDGVGLCRTEHMFFAKNGLTVMREMILAGDSKNRDKALEKLLPIQRNDFLKLFTAMKGYPVTIRLLDPPLHEFLPHSLEDMQLVADSMKVPLAQVKKRAGELFEFNPMLGKRGVRLAISMPEIYEMQARAIFEAFTLANKNSCEDELSTLEIMIPLVSSNKEVELIKDRLNMIANEIGEMMRTRLEYKLGVVVETPRAALLATDLASACDFFSFGTNDLTQMTYGLSRDDAGRFMAEYLEKGVFLKDPFHSLDLEGVGELIKMASERGRIKNPNLILGLCGEHGGDPLSINFCKAVGLDYVSCSPYRVPIARLAAAQASILLGEKP